MIDRSKIETEFSSPWGGGWEGTVYFIGIGVLIIGIAVISVNMNTSEVAEIRVSNEGGELQRA